MALPKWLLQVREGQEPYLYRWTALLATRPDMKPISGKQAKRYVEKSKAKVAEIRAKVDEDLFADDDDVFDENPITASPETDEAPIKKAEHPSFRTQETMLVDEITKIKSFRKTNTLEAYILEKYSLDMIPGELDEMQEQAESFVTELSRKGKLYSQLND